MNFLWINIYEKHVRIIPRMLYSQMKTYDVTKLTAEMKSSDNVQYRNKIYYFVGGFRAGL